MTAGQHQHLQTPDAAELFLCGDTPLGLGLRQLEARGVLKEMLTLLSWEPAMPQESLVHELHSAAEHREQYWKDHLHSVRF